VIGYGLGLAVTSRFLWTAPYTNEILDVDTSKVYFNFSTTLNEFRYYLSG